MDYLIERSTGIGIHGVTFGQSSFTNLYFVDDVSLLAELLDLLVPFATESASLELETNWQ